MGSKMYRIAIDPGLTATGFAVFSNGNVDEVGTIRPKGSVRSDKLLSLAQQLRVFYQNTWVKFQAKCDQVVIEQWESHSPVNRFQTMVACAEARGVIFALSSEFCDSISYLSKGKTPKTEADWWAANLGIAGSEHARDALHLGLLAGFCDGVKRHKRGA